MKFNIICNGRRFQSLRKAAIAFFKLSLNEVENITFNSSEKADITIDCSVELDNCVYVLWKNEKVMTSVKKLDAFLFQEIGYKGETKIRQKFI